MSEKIILEESNNKIINLIKKNEPFLISRLGAEIHIIYNYMKYNILKYNILKLSNNAGLYNINNKNGLNYIKYIEECLKNSNYLASFKTLLVNEQKYFLKKYNLDSVYSRILEPFYCCLENIKPWSHYLIDKKVLIINPFVDSFQKQLKNKFRIFKDKRIFLEGQKFIFYKSFNTSAGNHVHENWLETYNIMCEDISKLDFDIALLGCGGYGLPLCNFIKTKLNKSAIYIGGGLQLLFGVIGKRWEKRDDWKQIIKDNGCKFIRPSGDEILKNYKKVEGGCYW